MTGPYDGAGEAPLGDGECIRWECEKTAVVRVDGMTCGPSRQSLCARCGLSALRPRRPGMSTGTEIVEILERLPDGREFRVEVSQS